VNPDASNEGEPLSRLSAIFLCCVGNGVPMRSFAVALIVGTILNLINQGDAFFGGGSLNLTKLFLTYAVPYCVATYGAVSYQLTARGGRRHGRWSSR
jgi:hypothetical protein